MCNFEFYTAAMRSIFTCVMLGASVAPAVAQPPKQAGNKPMNVLFLVSDDMRAEWGVYGSPQVVTPNLDKLAQQGVRFAHAYCQYPLSGPSRASILSGRRPTTSKVYGNREWFGTTYPDWVSLPKYFKLNGYTTLRTGKIFHGGMDDTDAWTEGGEARQWSNPVDTLAPRPLTPQEALNYQKRSLPKLTPGAGSQNPSSDRWEALTGDAAANAGDTRTADQAIAYIRQSKQSGKPFFIACGLVKPHSPLVAPKQFFDLYDVNKIQLPPDFASLPMVPRGFPEGSIRLNNADLFINRVATQEEARQMILAYLACVSYVDWNVGRVLEELDRQGLRENTIIVFWSDHGYQLGEKGKWSKAGSLWEQGAHTPLIILDPRARGNGRVSPRTVELLDLYPTLLDLCGLPANKQLEGASLRPLLDNPYKEWDRPAYTVWNEHGKGVTGVVVRVEGWRYAKFFGVGAGCFLTDPVNDPDELHNLADDPKYKDVVARLDKLASDYVKGQAELSAPPAP